MASIDIKDAVIRLYEDYSLTEGFDDEQAGLVNAWAEAQLQQSADSVQDETEFEDRYNDITRILKMVNRFIIKRSEMDETKQRRFMELFIERAEQGKFPVKMASAPIFYEVVQGLDDTATIRAFLGFVESGDPNATASPPPPPRTAPYADLPVTSDDAPLAPEQDDSINIIDPKDTTSLRDSVRGKLDNMRGQKPEIVEAASDEQTAPDESTATEQPIQDDDAPSDDETADNQDDNQGEKQSKWGLFNLFKPSSIDDDNQQSDE